MLQSSLPSHPSEKVGADLLKDSTYFVVVDYYFGYVEMQKLTSLTSAGVISELKAIFPRHSIPVEFRSDNGPQFTSQRDERICREILFHSHDQQSTPQRSQ